MMSDTTTSNPCDIVGQTQMESLQLAFVGGPRDGQAICISAATCTIGSSEQATLRLVCKGVHPTHCVITRGEHGTTIKRMADDTYLNDATFEESDLTTNDVLTVGPLRFRVVAPAVSTVPEPEESSEPVASGPASNADSTEAQQLRDRCDELMSKLDSLQKDRSVDSQISSINSTASLAAETLAPEPTSSESGPESSDMSSLELRLKELEEAREQDRLALEAKEAEIEAARLAAEEARQSLEAMQQQQQDEAAADVASALGVEAYQPDPEEEQNYPQASRTMAIEMLNRLREDSVEEAAAEPEEAVAESGESAYQAESAYEQPNHYEQADPSGYEQSSYEQDSGQPAEETPYSELYASVTPESQPQAESGLEASASEPDYGQPAVSEYESPYNETPDQNVASDAYDSAGTDEEEELTYSEPEDSAPVDTASILAKFGHTFEDDDHAEPEANHTIAMDQVNAFVEQSEPENRPSGDEDESIDDYMTQLMARVGGGAYQTQSPAPSSSSVADSKTIMLSSDEANAAAPQQPASAAPLDPSEFVPRAVAPEASSNLRALRAVANTSARSAIDRHQRRSFDNKAYISWFIAIASAIVCFSMAFFAKNLVSLPTLVSMVSLLISFFATINALAFSAKAKIGARSTQKKLAATIEEASVPRLPAK